MRRTIKSLVKALGGAITAAACVAPLQAETLTVQGVYAANVDLPGDVEIIAVDRFAGLAGPDAQVAIMQALGSAAVEGLRHFRVVQGNPGFFGETVIFVGPSGANTQNENGADAVLSGTLRGESFDQRAGFRTRRECVARDKDGDCVRRKDIDVPCFERRVQLNPRLLLTSRDGRVLYANNQPLVDSVRFCRDDFFIPTTFEIGGTLIDRLAADIRFDLAPEVRVDDIRVMEARKGLKGTDRDLFGDAVRLTKSDAYAACLAFEDLETRNPGNVSVLFNNGLCAESQNDLVSASDFYRRALALDPDRDYPSQGLERIVSRERAAVQLAARAKVQAGRTVE